MIYWNTKPYKTMICHDTVENNHNQKLDYIYPFWWMAITPFIGIYISIFRIPTMGCIPKMKIAMASPTGHAKSETTFSKADLFWVSWAYESVVYVYIVLGYVYWHLLGM